MGLLRHTVSGVSIVLEPDHLVGRRPLAELRLDKGYVSAQHASIRWGGEAWEARDLNSRNGTLVNGVLLRPAGPPLRLKRGDRVAFGSPEQTWELVDDSPPRVMVIPLDRPGEPLFVEGDILPLPSQDDPKETVFQGSDGAWYLEREDAVVQLLPQAVFESAGSRYRFSCADLATETSTVSVPEFARGDIARVRLAFRVSMDEEYVEISVERDGDRQELPTRNFNYLLLVLARQRLEDAAGKLPDSACGWVDQHDFLQSLKMTPERLNIDVFRIRKQFGAMGIADGAKIIERRPTAKQLRIGVSSISIDRI